jgi:hypothetical protein
VVAVAQFLPELLVEQEGASLIVYDKYVFQRGCEEGENNSVYSPGGCRRGLPPWPLIHDV